MIILLTTSKHDDHITYYTIQKIISEEKYLLQSARTPEDYYWCEKCENVELILKLFCT